MHPDSSPSSDPADPEHSITSPSVNLASSVTNLPIPAFAQGWDASITRPSSLPERYDTRIPVESIFYLPLKNIHVVAQRCDHCAKLQQACNRALPACGRCAQIGKPCRVSNAGYVNLPGPRQSRQLGGAGKGGSRSTSTVASSSKEKRPRMSSEAVRLKRQNVAVAVASEGRQKRKYTVKEKEKEKSAPRSPKKRKLDKPASTRTPNQDRDTERDTSADPGPSSSIVRFNSKAGRKGPQKSKYSLPSSKDVGSHVWTFIRPSPPKGDSEKDANLKVSNITSGSFVKDTTGQSSMHRDQEMPPVWAESRADLLAALPKHPDIMHSQGLGYEGGFIDMLILEGPKWDEDEWTGDGTVKVMRKWRFSQPKGTPHTAPTAEQNRGGDGLPPSDTSQPQRSCSSQPPNPLLPASQGAQQTSSTPTTTCSHLKTSDECHQCSPIPPPPPASNSATQSHLLVPTFQLSPSSPLPSHVGDIEYNTNFSTHSDDQMSLDGTEEQEQHDFSKRALAPVLGDGDDNDGNNEDIGSEDEEMVDELADDDIMDFGVDAQAVPEDDVTRREDLGAGGAEWSNDGMGNSAIHEETHPGGSPVRRESITSNGPVYDLPLDALPHEALDIVHGNAADHSEVPNPLDDLPLEAMLFRNALETQDPFCVIVASNFALLPFSVPQKCAYMLVGFFVVVKFEPILESAGSTGLVSLNVTLEWKHNGVIRASDSHSKPWWQSYMQSDSPRFLAEKSLTPDTDCFNLPSLQGFPGIPSYPDPKNNARTRTANRDRDADDSSESDEEAETPDLPPAWHCKECGRLNAVAPFRSSLSWACSHCQMIGRKETALAIYPALLRDPYALPPPLPVPSENIYLRHAVLAGPKGEEYITYKFMKTEVVLQHIPWTEESQMLSQASWIFENLQTNVDFEPCDSGSENVSSLFYHLDSRKAFLDAPHAAQEAWSFMENLVAARPGLRGDIQGYARELKELRCTAWISKGTMKNQEIFPGYTLFLSTGASLAMKVLVRSKEGPPEAVQLEMMHGSVLFVHNAHEPIAYVVQHTGPSLLLAGRWTSGAPEEVLQVETSGRL